MVFPKYRDQYDFEIKDFTDTPIETCIERCAKRPEGKDYWKRVIMQQKNEFLVPRKLYTDPMYYLGELPKCVIFDLDGTLALMNGRSPFDESRCHEDLPNYPMVDIAKMFGAREDVTLICLSGRRDGEGRANTENWLAANGVKYDQLYMRQSGDTRNDYLVKKELFEEHIQGKYLVYAVFDDRPRVVQLWVELGLPIFAFGNPFHDF